MQYTTRLVTVRCITSAQFALREHKREEMSQQEQRAVVCLLKTLAQDFRQLVSIHEDVVRCKKLHLG